MKTIFKIFTLLLLAGVLLITGCKKSLFSDNFNNPEKAVTADIPRLYAGLFRHEKVMPRYWNLYTFHVPVLGIYSQTSGYTSINKVYEQPTNYTGNRWTYFYTHDVAIFRELEKYYNQLGTEAEKEGYQLFLETARIFFYDQTTQIVDMWGDIPFSQAGSLNATGSMQLAAYDKQEDIYNFVLTDLKRISDYLATVTPSTFYANQLTAYDYVNGGSLLKWRQYCNSLILRLAMRISYKNETTAKSAVQAILGNATNYPVVDTQNESIVIQANSPTSSLLPTDKTEVREGYEVNPFAPGTMINNIMLPANDPRLPVYFMKNNANTYLGIANTLTEAQVTAGIANNDFSRWDSTTITENYICPGILITAAEVQFLKAEAYERWGGGTAKTAYENGIRESIAFWFRINNESVGLVPGVKETAPTTAVVNAYINNPAILYGTDNLKKIGTQKWLDFNIVEANQAWAEWRRTKFPTLSFPADGNSTVSPNVPTRLLYPGEERSLNEANYNAVKANDNVTTKIFWDVQ
jgi:hypothetical protein